MATVAYHRVQPTRWHRLRPLPDRERLLDMYLQTCEHRSMEGLYFLPVEYVRGDLGWTTQVIRRTLESLAAAELVLVDRATSVVLLLDAIAEQPPNSASQISHALKRLRKVPATFLWTPFVDLATTHAPAFSEALQAAAQSQTGGMPVPAPEGGASRARTRSSSTSTSSNTSTRGGVGSEASREARATSQAPRTAGRHLLDPALAGGRS